eukprot:629480_1
MSFFPNQATYQYHSFIWIMEVFDMDYLIFSITFHLRSDHVVRIITLNSDIIVRNNEHAWHCITATPSITHRDTRITQNNSQKCHKTIGSAQTQWFDGLIALIVIDVDWFDRAVGSFLWIKT